MRTKFFFILFLFVFSFEQVKAIKTYTFQELEPLLHQKNDTTYLINFWATWCKPCIAEIPAIEKINQEFNNDKLRIILVSLDFPSSMDQNLVPFVKKFNIQSEVVLLNDPDSNSWINKVDKSWTGAIPGTLIYNTNVRKFYEKAFEYEELKNILIEFLE